jgi:iron complex outermembrane receptor protein
MKPNPKLRYAVAAILRGTALGSMGVGAAHAAASDSDVTDSGAIPEIVVTAERRSESLENVPITVQAITGTELQDLNLQTTEDILRYTPNVTFASNGPGQGNIFMRGLSAGGAPNQSQSTTSPFPNVALYLDDQSMQFPGRNNDPYLVDIERVEVLEGPQGTLFGGGAEAGAIRYITNKPKLDVTEGNATGGYGYTSGGDPSFMANATINLPLIPDTLAVRATVFTDRRGGYISNVPGTIAAVADPAERINATPSASNSALVGSNLNPVDYDGLRFSALWKINEDWSFLVQENYQSMEADGYFSDYPYAPNGTPLQPYQIIAFTPAYDKDKYESTSWTLNGKLPYDLRLVYTGSYLDRHIQQQADYSNYLTSAHGSDYDCTGTGARYGSYVTAKPLSCYAPVGGWNDTTRNTHLSQELRVSTPDDWRLRGLFGVFYEDFKIYDEMNFNYLPIPQCNAANLAIATGGGPDCLSAVGPLPGFFANDPSLRVGSNTAFGEDVMRGYRQTALFGSFDFDIIPKVLTITGGTRWFHYSEFEEGSEFYSSTSNPLLLDHANGVCTATGGCGFGINLSKQENGFRSRGNLTWHITPDIMAYYTWSQGFRPGGFNRTGTSLSGVVSLTPEAPYTTASATKQYDKPEGYDSDNLVNNEIGLKSQFFEHRLELNGSAYDMRWSNVQFVFFDPVHLGNTTFVTNGPSFEIKGFELQFVGRVTEGLTVQGSGSWNSSNQTTSPCLQSNVASKGNPTPIGACITQVNGAPYTNPFGTLNSRAPYSPPFEYNVRARYDFRIAEFKPFVSFGANYIGAMNNQPANYPPGVPGGLATTTLELFRIPGYTTFDAAVGVTKDNWSAQISGSNLTNSDAAQVISSGQFIESQIPLRPRVITFQFGLKF